MHLPPPLANSAAAVGRTLIGAPPGFESTGPFPVNYGIINGLTFLNPQKPPPGANDPSITVTPEHPLPIILINGTIATQGENWGVGAPVLANAGYKVYSFNYGNITSDPNFPIQATDDIRQSGSACRRSRQGPRRNRCTEGDTHRPFAGRRDPARVLHQ